MNRKILRFQLAIFGLIAASIVAYTTFSVLGVSLGGRGYDIDVRLATAGGLFEGSEVTYRGVKVGEVQRITITTNGVEARIHLLGDLAIPADSWANVHDLSVAGEQYLDLVSEDHGGPYLSDGGVIQAKRTTTPIPFSQVLFDLETWVHGLNPTDVATISRELGAAFTGTGPQLRSILADTHALAGQLAQLQPTFLRLLHNSSILLNTAARHAGDLDRFSASLSQLSTTLKASTPTINRLLTQAADSAALIDDIIKVDGSSAAVLMANLATFSGIQVANVPGLKSVLVAIPQLGIRMPQIVRNGQLQAAGLFNWGSPVCTTGVPLTSPLSGIRTPVMAAHCGSSRASQLAINSTGAATSARRTSAGTQVGGFGPSGLAVSADGSPMQLGWNGGQGAMYGASAWKSLLTPALGESR